MSGSSDSESDRLLLDPRLGLRKLSQQTRLAADCNSSIAPTQNSSQPNRLARSKLSLTQRKRLNSTLQEENDCNISFRADRGMTVQRSPSVSTAGSRTEERFTYGTPSKRFKRCENSKDSTDGSAPSTSVPALVKSPNNRTPVIIRRSQQDPQPSSSPSREQCIQIFQSPIKCPQAGRCQSTSQAHRNAYCHEDTSDSTSKSSAHCPSIVLPRDENANEASKTPVPCIVSLDAVQEPLPVQFAPVGDPAKMELVRKWVDSCDPELMDPIPEPVEDDASEPAVATGQEENSAHPQSPVEEMARTQSTGQKDSAQLQSPVEEMTRKEPQVHQGMVTPKRKNDHTSRNGSTGKQTAITTYFTPRSTAPTAEDQSMTVVRVRSVNIKELNAVADVSPDGDATLPLSTTTVQETEIKRSTKDQWSSLMSRMRGTAQTIRREMKGSKESQEEKPTTTEPTGRKCPFYRLIPGTGFAVDAFSYGRIKGVTNYFLSHFHYDHYRGLGGWIDKPVYCSKITANLVQLKIKVKPNLLRVIPLNESRVIENIEVVLIDANHCPGAVMFVFRFPTGRTILHVGDFRANSAMESLKELNYRPIDELYLDTTYCDENYELPPQEEVLAYVARLVRKYKDRYAVDRLLVVCGSYTIGKERVFMAAARELDCRVWAPSEKRRVLKCLEDAELSRRLVADPMAAGVHVLNMGDITPGNLRTYLNEVNPAYNRILALNPTGWEFDQQTAAKGLDAINPKTYGKVHIVGVPYSEHSGFSEMRRFVRHFRPRRIIPTVSVGTAKQRQKMESIFKDWLGRSAF